MRFTTTRAFCLVQVLTISTLCTVAHAQPVGALDPLLQPRASLLTGQSRVVVVARSGGLLGTVTQLIQLLGGTLGRPLPIINGRVATVPNIFLRALASNWAVQHVALDRRIPARWSVPVRRPAPRRPARSLASTGPASAWL